MQGVEDHESFGLRQAMLRLPGLRLIIPQQPYARQLLSKIFNQGYMDTNDQRLGKQRAKIRRILRIADTREREFRFFIFLIFILCTVRGKKEGCVNMSNFFYIPMETDHY